MRVRLLRPWKYRRVGTILNEVPDGAANVLIRRGHGEAVVDEVKPDELEEPKRYTKRARA